MRCLIVFALGITRAVPCRHFPMEDVIGLLLAVGPQQHLVGFRRERIGDHRRRRVVDLRWRRRRRGARSPRRRRRLLAEQHLANRQHHLCRSRGRSAASRGRRPRILPVMTALTPGTFIASLMSMFLRVRHAGRCCAPATGRACPETRGRRRSAPTWMARVSLRFIDTPTSMPVSPRWSSRSPRERGIKRPPPPAGAGRRPPAAPRCSDSRCS